MAEPNTAAPIPGLRQATMADVDRVTDLQRRAYKPMTAISGADPLPLRADYNEIMAEAETWLVETPAGDLVAALILQRDERSLLVWSVSVDPDRQSDGLGRRLLALAEDRARAQGIDLMRLYTNAMFTRNREIYRRFGYVEVRQERYGTAEPPWIIVHMEKPLS